MTTVITTRLDGVTRAQYDSLRALVAWERDAPSGLRVHVASFDEHDVLCIVEVWDSVEQRDAFARDRVNPALGLFGGGGAAAADDGPGPSLLHASAGPTSRRQLTEPYMPRAMTAVAQGRASTVERCDCSSRDKQPRRSAMPARQWHWPGTCSAALVPAAQWGVSERYWPATALPVRLPCQWVGRCAAGSGLGACFSSSTWCAQCCSSRRGSGGVSEFVFDGTADPGGQ
jgi:hypothetical protein